MNHLTLYPQEVQQLPELTAPPRGSVRALLEKSRSEELGAPQPCHNTGEQLAAPLKQNGVSGSAPAPRSIPSLDEYLAAQEARAVRHHEEETGPVPSEAVQAEAAADIRIPTGIISLDREIRGGVSRGKLHLIAAYTGYGKSSLMVQLAGTAVRYGHPVIIFHSPDMSPEGDYIRRLLSWESGIPYGEIPARPQSDPSLPSWIREQVFFFEIQAQDTSALSQIRHRIEEFKSRAQGTPLVLVDTIDGLDDSTTAYTRKIFLEALCAGLAAIAVDLKVPIWVSSQANDQAAHQDIVSTTNLRDARGKALPCSLFLGLGMSDDSYAQGIMTINAEKNRDGQPFVLRVRADLACQRFSDLHEPLILP